MQLDLTTQIYIVGGSLAGVLLIVGLMVMILALNITRFKTRSGQNNPNNPNQKVDGPKFEKNRFTNPSFTLLEIRTISPCGLDSTRYAIL